MSLLTEFREFAARGNVVDLAVGVIIGASFGKIVTSLVDQIIMPPIGLLLGKVDFSNLFLVLYEGKTPGPYNSLKAAQDVGAVTLNAGVFFNVLISFVIVTFAVFMLVKGLNKLRAVTGSEAAAKTKDCPFCFTAIPVPATRCPHCTSQL